MESESEGNKRLSSPLNPNDSEDDSMLDFKSPESKKLKSTRLLRSTKPTAGLKVKVESHLKVRANKHKEKKKKETSQAKKSTSKTQPSIESSFFKARDTEDSENSVRAGFVCPLCFKVCKDHESQALHMKICAIKHKLSTKQLMDAIELQKRQEEERKTLGLLAGPLLQERKKPVQRRPVQAQTEEADLQLGLALSKSLHEMEEVPEFNDLDLYREALDSDNSTEREPKILPQLEKFGFASSARATALPKTRKRKLNEITVLQTRTEEDRNRILAERIAEILMSSDAITQELQEELPDKCANQQKNMKSSLLKTMHCTESHLWEACTLQSEQVEFYVDELSEFIAPREKKLSSNDDPSEVQDPSSTKQSEDSAEKCETFGDQKRFYEMSTSKASESPREPEEDNVHEKCSNTLALDWAIALNDSSASDLIVNVSNGKRIWAHRLVLYVRYPNILMDVTKFVSPDVPSVKEKIDWLEVPYDIGLAFLEFVYCGRIQLHESAKEDENSVAQLRNLARKYQVQLLFDYLRKPVSDEPKISRSSNFKETRAIVDCNAEETDATAGCNLVVTRAIVHRGSEEADLEISLPKTPENTSSIVNCKSGEAGAIVDKSSEETRRKSKSPELNAPESNDESPKEETIQESQLLSFLLAGSDETALPETPKNRLTQSRRSAESTGRMQISNNSPKEVAAFDHIDMSPDLFDDTVEASSIFEKNCTGNELMDEMKSPANEKSLTPKSSSHPINVTPKIPSASLDRSLGTESNSISRSKEGRSSLPKQRSKLSLFIEKFKKENNRSDSDAESDASTILNIEHKRNRNPFDVRRHDRSSLPLNVQNSPLKKNGLDALEYNLSDADTEPCSPLSLRTSKTDLSENASSDESAQSLNFSLTQKHTEAQEVHESKTTPNSDKPSRVSGLSSVTIDSIDLSQCDTDEEEISMYTKYKKTHLHNSIADYRNFGSADHRSLPKRTDSLDLTRRESAGSTRLPTSKNESPIEEVEVTLLSDLEAKSPANQSLKRKRSIHSQESLKKRDSHSGSDTDIMYPDSPGGNQSPSKSPEYIRDNECLKSLMSKRASACKASRDKDFTSHNDDHLELSVSDGDKPNNASPSKRSSDKNINKEASVSGACSQALSDNPMTNGMKNVLLPNSPKARTLKSAAWLLSSAEVTLRKPNAKKDDSGGNRSEDELDCMLSPRVSLKRSSVKDDRLEEEMDSIFNHEIYLANVRMDDDVISEPPSPLIKSKSEGRLSSGRPRYSLESSLTFREGEKNGLNVSASQAKKTGVSGSVRKLQRKSVSHGNFTVQSKATSAPNFDACKCYVEKLREESFRTARMTECTTPTPDFELMDTPELHKELSKYGLKLQKRKRAIKLLSHIYNELHPIVPVGQGTIEMGGTIESDDEPEILRSEDDLGEDSDSTSSDSVIIEDQQLDEFEPSVETTQNIKEQFSKLIKTDRKLHNQILSYEPLRLEALHEKLKLEGLKSNKAALMDFLDKQCITYYMQDKSRWGRRRGAGDKNKRSKHSAKPLTSTNKQ